MPYKIDDLDIEALFSKPLTLTRRGPDGAMENVELANNPMRAASSQSQEDAPRLKELMDDLELIRNRHAAEIKRWVEYDHQVRSWREKVMAVISLLRKQLESRNLLVHELERQKNIVHQKDLEIERLRAELEKNASI